MGDMSNLNKRYDQKLDELVVLEERAAGIREQLELEEAEIDLELQEIRLGELELLEREMAEIDAEFQNLEVQAAEGNVENIGLVDGMELPDLPSYEELERQDSELPPPPSYDSLLNMAEEEQLLYLSQQAELNHRIAEIDKILDNKDEKDELTEEEMKLQSEKENCQATLKEVDRKLTELNRHISKLKGEGESQSLTGEGNNGPQYSGNNRNFTAFN